MKKNILFITLLLTIGISINATGVEWARIEIIPISIDTNSNILFKTKYFLDPQDAGATTLIKYGFLIINGENKWDEYYYFTKETKEPLDWEKMKILNENFTNNDFSSVKVYKDIVSKYNFPYMKLDYDHHGVSIDLIDENDLFWNRGYNPNLKVRSLDGLATYLPETKVLLCFQFENIYLIKNIRDSLRGVSTGADISLPNYFRDKNFGVINLDYEKNIDGIIIAPK